MSLKFDKANKGTDFTNDKGFTVQSDRDEAEINKIIARLEKGANTIRMNSKEPFYGDVSEFSNLQEALIKVQKSKEFFMDYEAKVRETFDNDPIKMVKFLEDPKNHEEAIKLGIMVRKEPLPEPNPRPMPPEKPA
ncbi:MAG: internal scaffolding protein [Microvirus sp.]|nr:MAG: internal scaffolding protein [Microvirus sp.]